MLVSSMLVDPANRWGSARNPDPHTPRWSSPSAPAGWPPRLAVQAPDLARPRVERAVSASRLGALPRQAPDLAVAPAAAAVQVQPHPPHPEQHTLGADGRKVQGCEAVPGPGGGGGEGWPGCAEVRLAANAPGAPPIITCPADPAPSGEEALRQASSYTIVRPGGLTNGPGGTTRILSALNATKEVGGGSIPRADVAAVCVDALTHPAARNVTVSIWSNKAPLPEGRGFDQEVAAVWQPAAGGAAASASS